MVTNRGHKKRAGPKPALEESASCAERDLAAAAGPAAVAALVATAVSGHDAAAFSAEGGVGDNRGERQRLLRVGLGGAQGRGFAGFGNGVFVAEEFGAEPAEDIVDDRFRVGDLLVTGPAARLEADVREFIDQELQRDAVLQIEADGGGERVYQARDGRAFL